MKLHCGAIITRIPNIRVTEAQRVYWDKWIEALESGKFKKATWALHEGDAFCPLGLACNVIDPKGWTLSKGAHAYSFRPSGAEPGAEGTKDYLIPWVRKFYGEELGPLGFHVGGRFPDGKGTTLELTACALAGISDSLDASFEEIAKIIRLALGGGYTYSVSSVED